MHLTVTFNFPDGTEVNDVETHCAAGSSISDAIDRLVELHGLSGYSSLVIVVVPE